MNYKLIFLAALALIVASCAKNEIVEPQSRSITVTASMPADEAQTRISLEKNAATPHGLILKWETGDKLQLCFKHNSSYYHADAPIVAGSISANGKTARFAINVPTEIPANADFDLYGVYQRYNDNPQYNKFETGSDRYIPARSESHNVTLDKTGSTGTGITSPMLCFSQTGIANSATPAIAPINLAHTGWIMALTLKNATSADINMPRFIILDNLNGVKWAWNGDSTYPVKYSLSSQTFSTSSGEAYRSVTLSINEYNWLPLYGQKIAAGASYTYYRWVATNDMNIPRLKGKAYINGSDNSTAALLPAKTVQKGRVYHIYMKWDGTNLTWGK